MIQKTYHFSSYAELDRIAQTVCGQKTYQQASAVLIQVYTPCAILDEDLLVARINQFFPKACIAGITDVHVSEDDIDSSHLLLDISFTFFEQTTLTQFEFDLHDSTSFQSGRLMDEKLRTVPQLRCLLIFYATRSNSINTFINEFHHHHIPIFGAKAGQNISQGNTPHVYGRRVYTQGIVAIAFAGSSLSVYMDSNLGWQPIGVDMMVTKVRGDSIAVEIDHKPAVNIYSKYLKVEPNSYFLKNVCEFPLIFDRKHLNVARVPLNYDEQGCLHFSADIHPREKFRLSYASRENIYAVSRQSAKELAEFKPDAVFIFACANIMQFLKKDFQTEIDIYKQNAEELSVASCAAELFVTPEGKGCDLNSTLVVIGLRETPENKNTVIVNRCPTSVPSVLSTQGEIPFVNRILAFLESTSQELNERNRKLKKIASTDQLTKIYNRRELEAKLEKALVLRRKGKTCGLLFLDIDHFKHINDTYGHDIGDMVLVAVVNQISCLLEPKHVFGRWGGEEFVYLLPDADENSLSLFAEKVRRIIDEAPFAIDSPVTISVGATLACPEDEPESFLKRADEAVYAAKAAGRNRVMLNCR